MNGDQISVIEERAGSDVAASAQSMRLKGIENRVRVEKHMLDREPCA